MWNGINYGSLGSEGINYGSLGLEGIDNNSDGADGIDYNSDGTDGIDYGSHDLDGIGCSSEDYLGLRRLGWRRLRLWQLYNGSDDLDGSNEAQLTWLALMTASNDSKLK
jgi:hypothetical protein